jgi:hypothetical protein
MSAIYRLIIININEFDNILPSAWGNAAAVNDVINEFNNGAERSQTHINMARIYKVNDNVYHYAFEQCVDDRILIKLRDFIIARFGEMFNTVIRIPADAINNEPAYELILGTIEQYGRNFEAISTATKAAVNGTGIGFTEVVVNEIDGYIVVNITGITFSDSFRLRINEALMPSAVRNRRINEARQVVEQHRINIEKARAEKRNMRETTNKYEPELTYQRVVDTVNDRENIRHVYQPIDFISVDMPVEAPINPIEITHTTSKSAHYPPFTSYFNTPHNSPTSNQFRTNAIHHTFGMPSPTTTPISAFGPPLDPVTPNNVDSVAAIRTNRPRAQTTDRIFI